MGSDRKSLYRTPSAVVRVHTGVAEFVQPLKEKVSQRRYPPSRIQRSASHVKAYELRGQNTVVITRMPRAKSYVFMYSAAS